VYKVKNLSNRVIVYICVQACEHIQGGAEVPSCAMFNMLSLVSNDFYTTLFDKAGHAVVQLVEALHYKLGGHGFDSRRCHWNFSLT
jgi:hypothetical protein